MELQKMVLSQYMLLNKKPTFKKTAADTGIQITRVFRLFNGSTMKLSEYQTFQRKVKEKMGLTDSLEEIAFNCSLNLNPVAIKEIEVLLKRKLAIWAIKNSSTQKSKTPQQLSA